jgi:transcriptional regulator GlxA family with amidase domain
MDIAVLTLDGFNEIDSFVALHIFGRVAQAGWRVRLAAVEPRVTSMNGVTVSAQLRLDDLADMDAVLIGSGTKTREFAADPDFLAAVRVDPGRQLIGSQCSGALILQAIGLLEGVPACTDLKTKPTLVAAGVEVLDQAFHAVGNVATAGGCLASQYLAAWVATRLAGEAEARSALQYVAPVGEAARYVDHAMDVIAPYCHVAERAAS